MRKIIVMFMVLGFAGGVWGAGKVEADVLIKVRALNPLETEEIAVINYALPVEITPEDILGQKVSYSMELAEGEAPRKTQFNISYDEETGGYFIDGETVLLPKEIVLIEVRVKDVWMIKDDRIESLRQEASDLLKMWETHLSQQTEQGSGEEEEVTEEDLGELEEFRKEDMKETVQIMEEEIVSGLDEIDKRQEENRIIRVGVEKHISAYGDNMDSLRQVQEDIGMLTDLMQLSAEEDEGQEPEGDELTTPDENELTEPEGDEESASLDDKEGMEPEQSEPLQPEEPVVSELE